MYNKKLVLQLRLFNHLLIYLILIRPHMYFVKDVLRLSTGRVNLWVKADSNQSNWAFQENGNLSAFALSKCALCTETGKHKRQMTRNRIGL